MLGSTVAGNEVSHPGAPGDQNPNCLGIAPQWREEDIILNPGSIKVMYESLKLRKVGQYHHGVL
jgi:hypothetical protein